MTDYKHQASLTSAGRPWSIAGMGVESFEETLAREKARSVLELLFRAARLLNERALAEVRRETKQPVRAAHTTLLPHIDLQGTRITVLAERLGISKQAVQQLVDELVEMGMLERAPDPTDARAKLVRFSKRGRAAMIDGLRVLQKIEAEVRSDIGDAKMRGLSAALAEIVSRELGRAPAP